MKSILIKFAAVALASALMCGAFAQSLLKQASLLITSPNVAQDLNLSKAQIDQRTGFVSAYDKKRDEITANMDATSQDKIEVIQKQLDGLVATLQNNLLSILTPAQTNRLKQIAIQQVGVDALADDMVAKDLALTAGQRTKIAAIRERVSKADDDYQNALSDALLKVPDPGSDPDALEAYKAKQQAIVKALKPKERVYLAAKAQGDKDMLAVLTPAQLKKWNAMQGKKLKVG